MRNLQECREICKSLLRVTREIRMVRRFRELRRHGYYRDSWKRKQR